MVDENEHHQVERLTATHRALAAWAADCAEHVLPLFAAECPGDERPRLAIALARAWSRDEVGFSMAAVRQASLDAHSAARSTEEPAARAAARAAGHAVAVAHVPTHAKGAADYAARAAAAAASGPASSSDALRAERDERRWHWQHLPPGLRDVPFLRRFQPE